MNILTVSKADIIRQSILFELRERIWEECTYRDVVKVYNEYLEDNQYEGLFYPMNDFEDIFGDSFKKLFPKLSPDFSFDSEGFWVKDGKIHSGDVNTYYDEVVEYDIDNFVEWVYDNGYQEKLGLEVE